MCKAITDLMNSSREEGLEYGLEQGAHNISVQTAQNFFKNGADFEMVQKSITTLTKEELQDVTYEAMSDKAQTEQEKMVGQSIDFSV